MKDIKVLRLNGKHISIMAGIEHVFNHGETTFPFYEDGKHTRNYHIKSVECVNGITTVVFNELDLNNELIKPRSFSTGLDFRSK